MSEKVTVSDLDALVEKIFQQRQKIEALGEETTKLNLELAKMKEQMVLFLKELGREKYATPLGTVSIKERWSVTTPKSPEDRAAFFNYLKEKGLYEELVSVNSQTLNAFFRSEWDAAIEKGEAMTFKIPGLSEPKVFMDLSIRKG